MLLRKIGLYLQDIFNREIKLVKFFKYISTCSRQTAQKYAFVSNRIRSDTLFQIPKIFSYLRTAIVNLIL